MAMLDEIGRLIQNAGIATLGTDLWLGEMQPAPDDQVGLFETPGAPPELFDRTDYPSLQVRVRARSYVDAETRINRIYVLLHGLAEVDVVVPGTPDVTTRYHLIAAKQPPFSLGSVERELHELACNFRVIRRNAARTPPSAR